MEKQRILAITIKQDVSRVNDGVVEAIKDMWRAQLKDTDFQVSFDVREIDPMARVRSLLRLVRSEYEIDQAGDDEAEAIEVTAESDDKRERIVDEP